MSTFDISETLAPNSDQLDAVDLLGGDKTFTVASVSRGSAEQPVNVHLAEFPRPWRPGKSMRRVLAACWGTDANQWVGRRVTLFCDPTIMFGGEAVGGTRIRALSHITKRMTVPLIVKRAKSASYIVEPLVNFVPPAALLAQIKDAAERAGVDLATIATEWAESHDGQNIGEATDIGALEMIRDDLNGRA